jgi:hypothetical protein
MDRTGPRPNLRRAFLAAALVLSTLLGFAADRPRIVFSRLAPTHVGLFLADADGKNERPLLPATSLDYNASFTADGKWVIFTSERDGSADIYRVRPDGTEMSRLTDGPSYDDQAALSPDGRTLAFVSTRGGGTANIWLLDLAGHKYTNLTKTPVAISVRAGHRTANGSPSVPTATPSPAGPRRRGNCCNRRPSMLSNLTAAGFAV